MSRPKLNIELDAFDRICHLIGLIAILLLIIIPFYYYTDLPNQITIKYDFNGAPKGTGQKKLLWGLTGVGLFLYFVMTFLNKFPHIFNYPQKITHKNAKYMYTVAAKMVRFLNTTITSSIAYITYATIQIALGNQNGLGTYFTPIVLTTTLSIVGYYLYQLFTPQNESN